MTTLEETQRQIEQDTKLTSDIGNAIFAIVGGKKLVNALAITIYPSKTGFTIRSCLLNHSSSIEPALAQLAADTKSDFDDDGLEKIDWSVFDTEEETSGSAA